MRGAVLGTSLVLAAVTARAGAEEEWLQALSKGLASEYSQDRHNALKQVNVSTARNLKVLWKVLDRIRKDSLIFDWYVRQGAVEALSNVKEEGAKEEIGRLLKSKKYPYSKEAVVYSVIRRIRKDFVKDYGGANDEKVEEAKKKLRKTRGLEYIKMMLPRLKRLDPGGERFRWIELAFQDQDSRVRTAALNGFLTYPRATTIPLLINNLETLKALEKKSKKNKERYYREWVVNRFVLEQLSGQYFRDVVEDWKRWWSVAKDEFSLEKRIVEELGGADGKGRGKTVVVQHGGVEVEVNMKIAGKRDGYPLLVIPWRGYEPDYFRPYFHGIEEFLRVYYLYMPRIEDFKGLKREGKSNIPKYPTKKLADVLSEYMKETGQERFAVMGHGPGASTLAMYLTASHSEQISHLIMINPRSEGKRYGAALENVKKVGRSRKIPEVVKGVDHVYVKKDGSPVYKPADAAERAGLNRALHNLHFADPTAPEVGTLDYLFELPGGVQVMNDDTWSIHKIFDKKRPRMPTLVCMGMKAPWTPVGDMQGVARFFRAVEAKFPKSSEMPFLFETYAFTRAVGDFFRKYSPDGKKEKKKKRSSRKKDKKKKEE